MKHPLTLILIMKDDKNTCSNELEDKEAYICNSLHKRDFVRLLFESNYKTFAVWGVGFEMKIRQLQFSR